MYEFVVQVRNTQGQTEEITVYADSTADLYAKLQANSLVDASTPPVLLRRNEVSGAAASAPEVSVQPPDAEGSPVPLPNTEFAAFPAEPEPLPPAAAPTGGEIRNELALEGNYRPAFNAGFAQQFGRELNPANRTERVYYDLADEYDETYGLAQHSAGEVGSFRQTAGTFEAFAASTTPSQLRHIARSNIGRLLEGGGYADAAPPSYGTLISQAELGLRSAAPSIADAFGGSGNQARIRDQVDQELIRGGGTEADAFARVLRRPENRPLADFFSSGYSGR